MSLYSISLKCGTTIDLEGLENANLSFVPCGQVDGKDQPILKYSHLWDKRQRVNKETYGKDWNAHALNGMTGFQLMTGKPTYRLMGKKYFHYVSLDIEKAFIDRFPEHVSRIRQIYEANLIGNPCVIKTKSDGLRLDVYTEYCGSKMSFKDADGMLFEILAAKSLARLDNRYEIVEGSILDMPTMPKTALQEIYYVVSEVATKEQSAEKPREVVEKSQIGDLEIHWDANNRSQLFPTQHCQVTSHTSNRDEVRFSKRQGGIDGKCFNCGGTWWEIEPPKKPMPDATDTPKKASDSEKESDEDYSPFFKGKKFLPMGMVNYLEYLGIHVISLKHEDFLRIYHNGIYQVEHGEILSAMTETLGERTFKMSYYNEVVDYLQKRITQPEDCQHQGFLNVKNGFLKVDDLTLEPHDPKRKSLIQLPVDFDLEAKPEGITTWLNDCLDGDNEQETLFYEAVGYTILQTTELQKMFFLLGPTQTGKSTAMHIIKALLGESNVSAVELAPLEDEANRFSRAQLFGKLANFSCDISPKYLTGDGNVKKIISGDPITGEYKFRPPFAFEPDCTMWAMANALPGSGDKSGAWYERMVILRFEKQYLAKGENKPDRSLKHTLTVPSELSGLLTVALICGKNALERGYFTESERSHEVIEEYKILNDHVLQFLDDLGDFYDFDDDEFCETYKGWCIDENIKPMSKAKLANATARHGIRRVRKKEDGKRYFVWVNTAKA